MLIKKREKERGGDRDVKVLLNAEPQGRDEYLRNIHVLYLYIKIEQKAL